MENQRLKNFILKQHSLPLWIDCTEEELSATLLGSLPSLCSIPRPWWIIQ